MKMVLGRNSTKWWQNGLYAHEKQAKDELKIVNCVTQLKLYTLYKLSSTIFYCLSVSQSVRHRCHPTKSPLFPIYTGIQALCWPNTIYKGIKALFWVTHSILGLVWFNFPFNSKGIVCFGVQWIPASDFLIADKRFPKMLWHWHIEPSCANIAFGQ